MRKDSKTGKNRTGLQMSPVDTAELEIPEHTVVPDPSEAAATLLRADYFREAEPLGSVPPPGTLKGMFKAGMEALSGHRQQALLDKLAERLAFERGGTRLYDAVLAKLGVASEDQLGPVDVAMVKRFRDQEAAHAALLRDVIADLGGDPTCMTPGANLVGVQSFGLMQSVTDPRTSVSQCLQSLLAAELIDTAAWELLVDLATGLGHDQLVERFREASAEETVHLATVHDWVAGFAHGEVGIEREQAHA